MNRKSTYLKSSITSLLVFMLPLLSHTGTVSAETVKSIDQITGVVKNPAMKRRWETAFKNGKLPPLNTLPIPRQPVTTRKVTRISSEKITQVRPVIQKTIPADVKTFSKDVGITKYKGAFQIIDYKNGLLTGQISKNRTFELLYKLPNSKINRQMLTNTELFLDFSEDIVNASMHKRVLLYDRRAKSPKIISLSEGSKRPYSAVLQDLGISVKQVLRARTPDNPAVTVTYKGSSITLNQGQSKSLTVNGKTYRINLVNSYAYNKKTSKLLEGQPYYVNLIIYE